MITSFGDRTTEDIFHGASTRAALKVAKSLWPRIRIKLDLLNACTTLSDLKVPPANRLEKLKGRWSGFYSVRVNDQYRITFKFDGRDCSEVRCVDYH
jgi:toxin HigB-1